MDLLTWLLIFTVILFTVMLTIKTGMPLYRYKKAKGNVIKVEGKIIDFYGEETVKRKGKTITSFYPIYECEIEGKKKTLSGMVRYVTEPKEVADNIKKQILGQEVAMLYDEKTGEIWCKKDLPFMKKQIVVRISMVIILLILMVVVNILL